MSIDSSLMLKMIKNGSLERMRLCSKKHYNSPNAKECWKCGEKLV